MEKILVTQGLNELKVIDNRIAKAIAEAEFIVPSKNSETNARVGITKEDFSKNAISMFDKINALIKRREDIKAAIIKSNAETEVEIGGEKMTVAKAIDTKESIEYKKNLLYKMQSQYNNSFAEANTKNAKVEEKINNMLLAAVGKDSKDKIDPNMYDAIAKPIKEKEEVGLVDPLDIKKKIDELEKYIEDFESEVDSKLQVSNCITYIEI